MGIDYVQDWRDVHARETCWAQERCDKRDFTVLDTETTGINRVAEMVEVAIIGPNGEGIYDGLLRPRSKIAKKATETHGIKDADVAKAPRLADEWDRIQEALMAHPILIIYNQAFDLRILRQSAFVHRLKSFQVPETEDLMIRFARWSGIWNPRQHGYKWSKLESGHRAAGDCRSCVGLMEKMARRDVTVEW